MLKAQSTIKETIHRFSQLMISWRLKCLSGPESDIQTIKGQHEEEIYREVYRFKALILRAAVKQHVQQRGTQCLC